jgi:hypothetical protein
MSIDGDTGNAVFTSRELIELILTDNVDPTTFVAASRINRVTYYACRASMPLLRSVCVYKGNRLTSTQFCGLLAVRTWESTALPHTTRGFCRLYDNDAVDLVLGCTGAMARIRRELLECGNEFASRRKRRKTIGSVDWMSHPAWADAPASALP